MRRGLEGVRVGGGDSGEMGGGDGGKGGEGGIDDGGIDVVEEMIGEWEVVDVGIVLGRLWVMR